MGGHAARSFRLVVVMSVLLDNRPVDAASGGAAVCSARSAAASFTLVPAEHPVTWRHHTGVGSAPAAS
jgi:hypothetical protein